MLDGLETPAAAIRRRSRGYRGRRPSKMGVLEGVAMHFTTVAMVVAFLVVWRCAARGRRIGGR